MCDNLYKKSGGESHKARFLWTSPQAHALLAVTPALKLISSFFSLRLGTSVAQGMSDRKIESGLSFQVIARQINQQPRSMHLNRIEILSITGYYLFTFAR